MRLCVLFAVVCGGALVCCQDNCRVQDGKDGLEGTPGRDGMPGQKGEKGQPALKINLDKVALDKIKGEMGNRGPQGPQGEKGFMGPRGDPGVPGPKGPTGSSGNINKPSTSQKPAFSVIRKATDHPKFNQPVIFDTELSNVNKHFNMATGKFTCQVPGVYYFVFHSVSEGHLCLRLKSDSIPPASVSFCDVNPRSLVHVVSGGAILQLAKDNSVWIEPFKGNGDKISNKMSAKPEKGSTVFNGFLIFHSS